MKYRRTVYSYRRILRLLKTLLGLSLLLGKLLLVWVQIYNAIH